MENINNTNAVDTNEIDLLELVMVVWRKAWVPVLSAICCAVLIFGFCEFVMAPEYTSETKLYVANSDSNSDSKSYSDVQVASRLANSYKQIFTSTTVCQNVAEKFDDRYTPGQIYDMITITTNSDSEIINLNVTCKSGKDAQAIARHVFEFGRQEIMRVIRAGWVAYIDEPSLPVEKSGPASVRNAFLAGVAGAAIACVVIITQHMLSNRVKSKKDLTDTFGDVPIIGVIPFVKTSSGK